MSGTAKPIGYQPFLECYFDAHMHIQSGNCAPLPIIWKNLPCGLGFLHMERGNSGKDNLTFSVLGCRIPNPLELIRIYDLEKGLTLEKVSVLLGGLKIVPGLVTQRKPTYAIGDDVVGRAQNFLDKPLQKSHLSPYVAVLPESGIKIPADVFYMLFAMTFDMEYAHIAGYDGQTIYHTDNDGDYFYYIRKDARAKETDGGKQFFTGKEKRLFVKWETQVYETKAALCKNPWNLVALYHYDPRRWDYGGAFEALNNNKKLKQPDKLQVPHANSYSTTMEIRGTWNFPFTQIVSNIKNPKNANALFLGFKMYTPHGYRPLDEKCRYLLDFYNACESQNIPIVDHCSPGGNAIPELKFYKQYLSPEQPHTSPSRNSSQDATFVDPSFRELDDAEQYFTRNFIHPLAWEPVLKKYNKLRICLAHTGGSLWEDSDWSKTGMPDWIAVTLRLMDTYPNVYSDISCFNYKNKNAQKNLVAFFANLAKIKYRKRIMFGTDWYLSALVGANQQYDAYCTGYKNYLDSIDCCLWARLTVVNPFYFYRLNDPLILENYKTALLGTIPYYTKQKMMSSKEGIAATAKAKAGVERLKDLAGKIKRLENELKEYSVERYEPKETNPCK